ncbi:MAG: glycosyl hydrolase [Saprospiraceae bacterium]|nr:glycosyl hydrolase [Saprospiraceae bacterium]
MNNSCVQIIFLLLSICNTLFSQNGQLPSPTNANDRMKAKDIRDSLLEKSIFKNIPFRNIGPAVQSARVTDIDVDPLDPTHFYTAYASSGLWETNSNGISFQPLFDHEAVMTIGDIAINWKENIIWVGTGENNSSRSSYSGVGIYKSSDHGKTWQHAGLGDSHHIGRIVIHPENPNVVWVAALGHLYSKNQERGVFKTTDGGASWNKVLYVDDSTGAIDLVIDPTNDNHLFAAMWHRERLPWNFVESGSSSGIYESNDGGETWNLFTTKEIGFPYGENVGRIGLDIAKMGSGYVLYAVVDNFQSNPKKEKTDDLTKNILTKEFLLKMSNAEFLSLEKDKIDEYLKTNEFPKKITTEKIIEAIKSRKISPASLVEYTEDANAKLVASSVVGAELYKYSSVDKKWAKCNQEAIEIYNTYGYYFAQVRVNPKNVDEVYLLGVPIIKSQDGGKTFKSIENENVHADHHALWINPKKPDHLIDGNDGGINISYDGGKIWTKCNTPPVGQFYSVNFDTKENYNVFGGLQDNGVWMGNNRSSVNLDWQASGHAPFRSIMGGDGMQVRIDTRTNNIVYTGYQFGHYYRINLDSSDETYIRPTHELGERPLRFNWQTPLWLSQHQQDILYVCANKVFRSFDRGDNFECLSPDLTKGSKEGDVPYGTITSFHESPLIFGKLIVGTDDGLVHCTLDGGVHWNNISDSLPQNLYVSRVQASSHNKDRFFVVMNGYRFDHFEAYFFVSENNGATWERRGQNLPTESVNVIKEDPFKQNIIYLGTDNGLYISIDFGRTFSKLSKDIPMVAVHDLAIQPITHDLIVGTHGRAIYVGSLKEVEAAVDSLDKPLVMFDIDNIVYDKMWGSKETSYSEINTPKIKIPIYAKTNGDCFISINDEKGVALWQKKEFLNAGISYVDCDLTINSSNQEKFVKKYNDKKTGEMLVKAKNDEYYLPPGEYTVYLKSNNYEYSKRIIISIPH